MASNGKRGRCCHWFCGCNEKSIDDGETLLVPPQTSALNSATEVPSATPQSRRAPVSLPLASRSSGSARVLLHVYDLGDSFWTRGLWNSVAKEYGAFHTGVEVYGREWLFGATAESDGDEDMRAHSNTRPTQDQDGITWHLPKQNLDHSYRETLSMGFTPLSEKEVFEVVDSMKPLWKSSSYSVFSRNCHDFSHEFCLKLGAAGLPTWINALAPTSASTYEYLETTDSGYDGGEAVFDLLDSARRGLLRSFGFDTSGVENRNQSTHGWGQ